VSHSLYFLAATWLAGQAGDTRPMPQAGPGVIVESAPGGYVDGQAGGWQPQRRGLFSRIGGWFGGWFGRGNSGGPYYNSNGQIIQGNGPMIQGNGQVIQGNGPIIQQPMIQQPAVQPRNTNEPPLPGDKVSLDAPVPGSVVVSARQPLDQASPQAEPSQLDLPVADRFKNRLGHEADYTWVVGQLYRLGNMWVLRYALAEEKDRHGGSVLLTTAADMQNFREGDLVSVQGQILNGGRHSEQIPCPVYRATEVSLVERGD
jgi:hypothetical protein